MFFYSFGNGNYVNMFLSIVTYLFYMYLVAAPKMLVLLHYLHINHGIFKVLPYQEFFF